MYAIAKQSYTYDAVTASPRPFLVRWVDEDKGSRSIAVLALDEFMARSIIEQVTDQVVTQVHAL